jgi:hypothetical protein
MPKGPHQPVAPPPLDVAVLAGPAWVLGVPWNQPATVAHAVVPTAGPCRALQEG